MIRLLRSSLLGTLATTGVLLAGLLAPPPAEAVPASASGPHRTGMRVLDYDLGPRSFTVAVFHADGPDGGPGQRLARLDLAGRVYLPQHVSGRRLPLVVITHGLWWTCSDRPAFAQYEKASAELSSPDCRDALEFARTGAAGSTSP